MGSRLKAGLTERGLTLIGLSHSHAITAITGYQELREVGAKAGGEIAAEKKRAN
jgi:hypothetical protein